MSKEPTAADRSEVSSPACDSAAQKGALWLKAQMRGDGSLRHATSLSDYYKVCYGLAVTGHNAATEQILDYFAGRFLMGNGDLDGTGCPWFEDFRIYAHGWIIAAAMARGRFDIAYPILRFLSTFHDSRSGGFFTTAEGREQGDGSQEIMTTAMAGIACVWGGRLDIARATGRWMRNLYDEQPDLSRRLCFVWHSRNGLVVDFPKDQAREYCVSTSEVSQRYYQYGIAAAFLTSLHAATGEQEWLKLSQRFLEATRYCAEDVYLQPQSGKIGWGAAWTYRLTRDPRDRGIAEAVQKGLLALQSERGWWSVLNVYDYEMTKSPEPSADITGEFVAHLGNIELALQK